MQNVNAIETLYLSILGIVANYNNTQAKYNVTEVLRVIRGIINQLETNISVYNTLDKTKRVYYFCKQGDDDTNAKHLKHFNNLVTIVEYFGGNFFNDDTLVAHGKKIETKLGNPSKTETEYEIIAREQLWR